MVLSSTLRLFDKLYYLQLPKLVRILQMSSNLSIVVFSKTQFSDKLIYLKSILITDFLLTYQALLNHKEEEFTESFYLVKDQESEQIYAQMDPFSFLTLYIHIKLKAWSLWNLNSKVILYYHML